VINAGPHAKRVAVVGAGPSGLTAAHYLSLEGHSVTVFEREKTAGGMLMAGIPEYRMPRGVLEREIRSLINENIELKFGKELGTHFTVEGLLKDGYHAVYLAFGSHKNQKLGIKGEEAAGVMAGISFLKDYNLRGRETATGRVGIIGGGNSAIDAARVAMRQKAVKEVTVFYRRSQDEMPAYPEEIEAALEEGVAIVPLVTPLAIREDKGRLKSVTFIRNRLGEKDATGRRRPEPVPGTEKEVELDTFIIAISEQPESERIDGVKKQTWGGICIDPETMLTNVKGVFAGGEAVTGPGTVIDAIGAGKKAAKLIHRFVGGRGLVVNEDVVLPDTYIAPAGNGDDVDQDPERADIPHLAVVKRNKNFCEVELSLSASDAMAEAKRCLRCDLEFTAEKN
jgi:NADH-quinone oxidoreductase subunit F